MFILLWGPETNPKKKLNIIEIGTAILELQTNTVCEFLLYIYSIDIVFKLCEYQLE